MSAAVGAIPEAAPGPLVSVGVPVYNGARFLRECLDSIFGQTYANLEVVVCDNASTDNTWKILSGISDPRLRIFRNEKNIGAFPNWNRCMAESKGEFVAVYHADDVYEPDIVKEEVEFLLGHPEAGAVFARAFLIDDEGRLTGRSDIPSPFLGGGTFGFPEILRGMIRYWNFIFCPTFMARASVLARSGPFRPDLFGWASDAGMWLTILEHAPIGLIDRPLVRYRLGRHQGTHAIEFMRTEPSDQLRVVDHFLSSPSAAGVVPRDLVARHETAWIVDRTRCLRNMIKLGMIDKARSEARKTYSLEELRKYFYGTRGLNYLLKRICYTLILESGFGKFAGKVYKTWGSRS